MNRKIEQYDLIIAYSGAHTNSTRDKKYKEKAPFSDKGRHKIYNYSYCYFLSRCKKKGIKAAFAISEDIIGPGLFQSFWTYDKEWIRHESKAHSKVLFDKFTPVGTKQKNELKLLTSPKYIYTFNDENMKHLFENKLRTYKQFKEFAIPTVKIISPTKQKIVLAKTQLDRILKKHRYCVDFNDDYIIKDNKGVGGFKIYKVDFKKFSFKEIIKQYRIDNKDKKILSYVIQPFINHNKGFEFGNYSGFMDLRLILLNHKIVQAYTRIAKKSGFKSNIHQGGNLVYMPIKEIPKDVMTMTKKIIKKLDTKWNLNHSLYSLDFIRSNNGNLFFIEGNSNPGIVWNEDNKQDQIKSKELIDCIVNELKLIIKEKRLNKST